MIARSERPTTEVFVGVRERFALSFVFDASEREEPYENEDTISWGHLQLWVDGINLCAHLEEGETVNEVSWYVLPLLEWLASNWDALFHEQKIPLPDHAAPLFGSEFFAAPMMRATMLPPASCKSEQQLSKWDDIWYRWFSAHSLANALSGAMAPDVVIRRWRDLVEFSWTAHKPAGSPDGFRFVYTEGGRRILPSVVSGPAFDFLNECVKYLQRLTPSSVRLKRLRRALQEIERPEPESGRRYAFLAGLGSNTSTVQRNWVHFIARATTAAGTQQVRRLIDYSSTAKILPGAGAATLMFGCLSPSITSADIDTLTDELLRNDGTVVSELFFEISTQQPFDYTVRPWQQGYSLATHVLTRLKQRFDFSAITPIRDIIDGLGIPVRHVTLLDKTIRGVSVATYDSKTLFILLNDACVLNGKETGRRFTLAHELGHMLFDRNRASKMGIASGPWAPPDIEKRANAFAAMLLMPPELIDGNIPRNAKWTRQTTAHLANKLQCGFTAMLEHLTNLGYISEVEMESIEDDTLNAAIS